MSARFPAGPPLGGLAIILILAACGAASSTSPAAPTAKDTPASGSAATSAPVTTPTSGPSAPSALPSPSRAPSVTATVDVAYEAPDARGLTKKLDVYVPVGAGSSPVVVMLHGGEVWKGFIAEWARAVSADGFVVFGPDWLENAPGLTPREKYIADSRHATCAIAFARERAAEYGGDPATLVVFGHSGGANVGGTAAFNPPPVSDGCLASDAPATPTGLVTFEGDWLSMDPRHDKEIAADPAVLDAATPWAHLAAVPDLPVVVLVSEGEGGVVEVPALDPPVDWRTARDPLALRERFLAAGIRADVAQQQAILAAALEAQGHPVTLRELPDSGHSTIGEAGLEVLREAIREAAGE